MTRQARFVSGAILSVLSCVLAAASDPPDSKLNPQSGYIETVDSYWNGSLFRVRHVANPEGQLQQVTILSAVALDELGPRLVIGSNGDTWAVWWRDDTTDNVAVRKRTYSSGTWGTALVLES